MKSTPPYNTKYKDDTKSSRPVQYAYPLIISSYMNPSGLGLRNDNDRVVTQWLINFSASLLEPGLEHSGAANARVYRITHPLTPGSTAYPGHFELKIFSLVETSYGHFRDIFLRFLSFLVYRLDLPAGQLIVHDSIYYLNWL
ncbi:hypothetical protein KQX54_001850 [Cotesia glomerata]|uniref:Uncharacterized protein n=1 Tax=Cotesia glomerata TaxID=32391 RepID=A0AAV7HVB9_COTGL|nr:hypothetical protein KQX54_001850 [Cotesia glomerata]